MSGGGVRLQLLGPIAASNADGPCELGGPKQRRLLAAIAIDHEPVSADRLIERVWGDALPADPHNTLRTAMTRLRQALGDGAIVTDPDGWHLDADVTTDASEFEHLVEAASDQELDTRGRLSLLDEALTLWRGDALADVASEEWARTEARRLDELRLLAIERRFEALIDAGMHTEALPGLTAESAAHPLRDRLVGLRMLALYRTGRKAEATRVFQAHRERLADEVGLEPGPDLVELDRRILADDLAFDRSSPSRQVLRGYQLGDQLGEGAFATVFRGTQPSVGREVAVKIIRSQLANRPEFIRRFEAEAHLVARLEHPYIVPLYDYWREPGRACLVFRYLRGGTLEQRLAPTTGLPLDECVTMVEQVGSALAEAHLAGVVHRDVKPANVFLDERGNYYLGDFGIALESAEASDPAAALSAGSPAYASPEQLRREPVGPAADVHGLAISLYESLTGRLPFPDAANQAELLQRQLSEPIPSVRARRPDVPPAVDEVVARATAKNPDDRYQTVEQLVAELQAAAGRASDPAPPRRMGTATVTSGSPGHNPYKGLRAFAEADSGEFFGRERLVDRMIESLQQPGTPGRVLAVVGPSGIGKSSAVRAGLLPALRGGAVPGSAQWLIATTLPGNDPFEEIAAALLRVATSVPDNLMGQLTDDHRGLARVAKALAPSGAEILLLIDQFEELFTLSDPGVTKRFLDALEYAITDARCPLRVVLTVRADFWDRPLRHGSFSRLIDGSIVNVTALAPDELERAIVAPAARLGAEFEPGLVSEIIADLADQPGALPLLQYALTQLWDERISELLTKQSYREMGGVAGALAGTAEELYGAMSAAEQTALRSVCGRLVSPGAGTEDTRRRALRSELGDRPEVDVVLDTFGGARLLSFDRDDASREPTVEIAHEALIREWDRLRGWIDDDREGLQILRHLHEAAIAWDTGGRPDSELYRGGRLDAAEAWAADHDTDMTVLEQSFLEASVESRRRAEQAEREQLEQERRSNRRLRTLLGAVAVVAAMALIAGAVALGQRSEANRQRAAADDQRILAEDSAREAESERERAEVAAGEAETERLRTADAADEADSQRAIAEAAAADADQARFDAEVRRMVSDSRDLDDTDPPLAMQLAATAYSLDPTTTTLGALQDVLARTDGFLGAVATDREFVDVEFAGRSTFVTRSDDTVEAWGLDGTSAVIASTPDVVDMAVDGSLVVLLDIDGTAEVIDLETNNATVIQTGVAGGSARVAVDGASGWIATSDSSSIEAYDSGGERSLRVNVSDIGEVRGCDACVVPALADDAVFASIGLELFRFSTEGEVEFRYDFESLDDLPEDWQDGGFNGEIEVDATADRAWFQSAVVGYVNATDGTLGEIFTSSLPIPSLSIAGGQVLHGADLLTVADGTQRRLDWAGPTPTASSMSPDGTTVVFAGSEGLQVWALDGRGPITRVAPTPEPTIASLDATNGILSWTAWPRGIHGLYDLDAREAVNPDLGNAFMQNWLPSGSLTTWGLDGRSRVWSADSYEEISGDLPPQIWSFFLTTPDDGAAVVGETAQPPQSEVPSAPGAFTIRDIETGEVIAFVDDLLTDDLNDQMTRLTWLHFSPDGTLAAAPRIEGTLGLFDTSDWSLIRTVDVPDQISSAAFSHDGRKLAMHAASGQVHLLDVETGNVAPGPLASGARFSSLMTSMSFSPDDRRLQLGVPGGLEIWDIETGQQIGTTLPNASLGSGTTSYDGRYGITADSETTYVWDLDVDRYLSIACTAAGRDMTDAEWEQYGIPGEPIERVCSPD